MQKYVQSVNYTENRLQVARNTKKNVIVFLPSKGHFHSDKLAESRKPHGNRSDHLFSGLCARGEVVCKGFAKCNWFSWCRHAGTINSSSDRRSEPEPVLLIALATVTRTNRRGLPLDFERDYSTHCCVKASDRENIEVDGYTEREEKM